MQAMGDCPRLAWDQMLLSVAEMQQMLAETASEAELQLWRQGFDHGLHPVNHRLQSQPAEGEDCLCEANNEKRSPEQAARKIQRHEDDDVRSVQPSPWFQVCTGFMFEERTRILQA